MVIFVFKFDNLVLFKQPLGDAIYYKNHEVIKLLEKHGAKPLVWISFLVYANDSKFFMFIQRISVCTVSSYCELIFQMAPMHVKHAREVPEYEIDPHELDFTNSVEITKVICCFSIFG